MTTLDILLIQPPVRDFYLTQKRTIPYGLCSIATAIKQKGFSVQLFDALARKKSRLIQIPYSLAYLDSYYGEEDRSPFSLFFGFKHFGYSYQHIGKLVKQLKPKIIGISSLFTAYSGEALKTAETAKKNCPETITILGGHHPTELPESVLSHDAVDFILRGEGEISLPLFIDCIKNGRSVSNIPGIGLKKKSGEMIISEPVYMDKQDSFPQTDLNFIKGTFYQRKNRKSIVTVSSRGCPMKCSYCCFGNSACTYRHRSVDSVIQEIKLNSRNENIGFIDFEDEHLSLNNAWFMEFLDKLIEMFKGNDIELRAMNGLYPPSLNEKTIVKMKQAGFKTLNLSLGSSDKVQLKRFNRPDILENLDHVLHDSEKHRLDTVCYIIVGAPHQTPESSIKDLLFLAERRTLAGVSVYYPAPGSVDFLNYSQEKRLPDTFDMYRSSAIPISHTTSRIESLTLLRLGRILNFIKHIIDSTGIGIDDLKTISDLPDLKNRDETGTYLLQMFLKDGNIYGITKNSKIYKHQISQKLTHMFLKGLGKINIRGVK